MQHRKPILDFQWSEIPREPNMAPVETRAGIITVTYRAHLGDSEDEVPGSTPSLRLTQTFHLHHAQLLRFARLRIPNPADAEDLVQEAFLSASRAYSDRPADELRPLLFTILRNLTRDYLKSGYVRSRQASADVTSMGDSLACPRTASPEQKLIDAQLLAIAETAMDALRPRQRQALELHRLEGLTQETIARRLGVSPRTVRNDIAEALAAVAKALSRSGVRHSDKPE